MKLMLVYGSQHFREDRTLLQVIQEVPFFKQLPAECWFYPDFLKGIKSPKTLKSNMNGLLNCLHIQKSILFPWDGFSRKQQC